MIVLMTSFVIGWAPHTILEVQYSNRYRSDSHSILQPNIPNKIVVKFDTEISRTFKVIPNHVLGQSFKSRMAGIQSFDLIDPIHNKRAGSITRVGKSTIGSLSLNEEHFRLTTSDGSMTSFLANPIPITPKLECGAIPGKGNQEELKKNTASYTNQNYLRKFRLAVVTTGGYYQDNGASDELVMASIVDAVARLNLIYLHELGVVFELELPYIGNISPGTDEFFTVVDDQNANPNSRISQAADAINNHFSPDEYDLGIVFSSPSDGEGFGLGGIALFDALCQSTPVANSSGGIRKGGGWSGVTPDIIQTLAHEIGHMLGARHTFNGTGDFCTSNIASNAAYEIASGTTIMAYYTLCGEGQNVPNRMGLYFHAHSVIEMLEYLDGVECGEDIGEYNYPPIVEANPCDLQGISIPKGTPFILRGQVTDIDHGLITSSWEQYDEDGPGTPTQGFIGDMAANSANAPIFRSYFPSRAYERTFPDLNILRQNELSDFERLSNVARQLSFRYTARDAQGGVTSDLITMEVASSGPLTLSTPNGGEVFTPGEIIGINWQINGSDNLCESVDIELSIDGGTTFNQRIAENVAYRDGFAEIELPATLNSTEQARIRIICSDNDCVQFFDLSDSDFSINGLCQVANTWIVNDDPLSITSDQQNQLNLNLSHYASDPNFLSFQFGPSGPMATPFGEDEGSCQLANFAQQYQSVDFVVSESGEYYFWLNNFLITALFPGADPQIIDPCPSHLDVNQTFTNRFNFVKAFLIAGVRYSIVVYGDPGESIEISPEGPGQVLFDDAEPGQYQYLAFDRLSGIIVAQSFNSNFTTLPVGEYEIRGIKTVEMVDLTGFVGLRAEDLQLNTCYRLSSNVKEVRIREFCSIREERLVRICPFDEFEGLSTPGTYESRFILDNFCDSTSIVHLLYLPVNEVSYETTICQGESFLGYEQEGSYLDTIPTEVSCDIASIQLSVESYPEIEFNLEFDQRDVCEGGSVLINAIDVSGNSSDFIWEGNSTGSQLEVDVDGYYSVSATNGAGCQSTDSIYIAIQRDVEYMLIASICADQTFEGYSESGIFADTFRLSSGCDSIRHVNLTVLPKVGSELMITICENEEFEGYDKTGTYQDIFSSNRGCDSLRTLHLTVIEGIETMFRQDLCPGESVEGYTMPGIFIDTFPTNNGCDSIRTLEINFTDVDSVFLSQQICYGESFESYNVTGNYLDRFVNQSGCDSIRILKLEVMVPDTTFSTVTICQGESVEGYFEPGLYTDQFVNRAGCDSIRVLELMVESANMTRISYKICEGESIEGYTSTGLYFDTLLSTKGCDSIRMIELEVIPIDQTEFDIRLCEGEDFEGYTESATYVDVFPSSKGCDSVRIINLTVIPASMRNIDTSICSTESFMGHTSPGTYIDTLSNALGCDSILKINLTVLSVSNTTMVENICRGDTIMGYSESGIYRDIYSASNGCDSVRLLDLTVIEPMDILLNIMICQGSSFEGYSESGIYVDQFVSAQGCDSTRTLVLEVTSELTTELDATLCPGESLEGYEDSGIYVDTLISTSGCDSIRTLNLTIVDVKPTFLDQAICESEEYLGYTESGTYVDTILNAEGCETVRTLNLEVLESFELFTTHQICPGEQFNGYSEAGIHVDTFIASNGCDSIRVLDLIVLDAEDPMCKAPNVSEYDENVIIFPNPATDHIQMIINESADIEEVTIFDSKGAKLAEFFETNNQGYVIAWLPQGIYILRARIIDRTTTFVFYKKFIKI